MSISVLAIHHGGGIGGAPVSLLKLLAGLDHAEFAAEAIFTEPGAIHDFGKQLGVPSDLVRTGGALFYSAHARLTARGLAWFVRTFPGAVQAAQRTLARRRPDVVNLNTSVLLAWAAAARRERVPVVWTVREVLGPNPSLRAWQANFILRHARRVVGISNAVRECFPEPSRVALVYNAVDLSEFSQFARISKDEWGISPGHQVVMIVGSVQHPKGHWLLLDALARLPDHIDLVLVTGGVGSAYQTTVRGRIKRRLGMPSDNLDALLRDARRLGLDQRIRVTGFRQDVAHVLDAADVLVFPSLKPEGFGRPIIEAMALGRAVVATDVGPSAEILGSDAGLLVRPDPASLATALKTVLAEPETRTRMGQAGRARVEREFTLERQVAEMSTLYREAALSA